MVADNTTRKPKVCSQGNRRRRRRRQRRWQRRRRRHRSRWL